MAMVDRDGSPRSLTSAQSSRPTYKHRVVSNTNKKPGLGLHVCLYFQCRRIMAMTHTHARNPSRRSVGSTARMQTDGQTKPIVLTSRITKRPTFYHCAQSSVTSMGKLFYLYYKRDPNTNNSLTDYYTIVLNRVRPAFSCYSLQFNDPQSIKLGPRAPTSYIRPWCSSLPLTGDLSLVRHCVPCRGCFHVLLGRTFVIGLRTKRP